MTRFGGTLQIRMIIYAVLPQVQVDSSMQKGRSSSALASG